MLIELKCGKEINEVDTENMLGYIYFGKTERALVIMGGVEPNVHSDLSFQDFLDKYCKEKNNG